MGYSGHRAGFRVVVVGLLSAAFLCVAPLAQADDLGSQETAKQNQITQNAATIQKNKDALDVAANNLLASQQQLASAQADLAVKQAAVQAAQAQDDLMAANLSAAQATLSARQDDVAAAQAAVAEGEAAIAAQKDQIGLIAQVTAQQNTTLLSLSMLLSGGFNTGDINNQVQWASMVFTANEDAMCQLEAAQTELVAAQAEAAQAEAAAVDAEAVVETQKAASAAQLVVTQQAQAAAADAAANVAAQVAANQKAQADADAAVKQSEAEQAQLQADLAKIQAQVQAQIKADQAKANSQTGNPANNQPAPSSGTFFQRPVSGPVTSPYGWRTNPILHTSEFHPGVDFGASCGTPILAAASGTVTYAGWNGGYGNYTSINHGVIGGNYYTTGYGHQSKILVSVGQHVSRGQVIGLVGTTGLSTGCHVHFNVLKNGQYINGLPLV